MSGDASPDGVPLFPTGPFRILLARLACGCASQIHSERARFAYVQVWP